MKSKISIKILCLLQCLHCCFFAKAQGRTGNIATTEFYKSPWFFIAVIIILLFFAYRWITSLRKKIQDEKVLNYFATSLYGQNTIEEIFWDVAKNCISKLGFEDCVIYLYDESGRVLVQTAAYGPKNPGEHEIYNRIEIPIGSGIVGSVAANRRAEIISDTSKDSRYIVDDRHRLSEISVPLFLDRKLFGVIDSEHSRRNFFKKYHLDLLERISQICAEKISKYMVEEKLRAQIARDLHDEIGSTLTSISIFSNLALQQQSNEQLVKDHLQKIKDNAFKTMESISDIVWAINPANDTIDRFILKLKEFAAEMFEPTSIRFSFKEEGAMNDVRFNLAMRKDLYLVFKEAINNIVKYSNASTVEILIICENEKLHFMFSDNGKGFDTSSIPRGNGLANMRTRIEQLGGTFLLDSGAGRGTTITIDLNLTR